MDFKVSFDFDSTLSRGDVQTYCKDLINRGFEVWINTTRIESRDNSEVFEVAERLGIPKERIVFTNMQDKYPFLKDKGYLFHLDDDWIEINHINRYTNVRGISCFGNTTWRSKCERIIYNKKDKNA